LKIPKGALIDGRSPVIISACLQQAKISASGRHRTRARIQAGKLSPGKEKAASGQNRGPEGQRKTARDETRAGTGGADPAA